MTERPTNNSENQGIPTKYQTIFGEFSLEDKGKGHYPFTMRRLIHIGDVEVPVTRQEYRMLSVLLERQGDHVSSWDLWISYRLPNTQQPITLASAITSLNGKIRKALSREIQDPNLINWSGHEQGFTIDRPRPPVLDEL